MSGVLDANCEERDFVLALLMRALADIFPWHEPNLLEREMREHSLRWVMDNDDYWILSFISVCEMLGINPSWLRGMIAYKLKVPCRRCPPSFKAARPIIDRPRSQRRYAAKDDDSDGWDAMYKLGSSLHMAGYKEGYRNE